jgi:nicotinamidase-related amidase
MRLDDSILVIIDMQERLLPAIAEKDDIIRNIVKLGQFARIMNVPVLFTEQEKLGPTVSEIRGVLGGARPVQKVEFDCFRSPPFVRRIAGLGRDSLILAGVEAHICVAQTAIHGAGSFCIHVVADAVSSREVRNREIALDRMGQQGVVISSTEMAMYELMARSGTDEFREVLKLVK